MRGSSIYAVYSAAPLIFAGPSTRETFVPKLLIEPPGDLTLAIGPTGNHKIIRARHRRYFRKLLSEGTRRIDPHDRSQTDSRSRRVERRADLSWQNHEIAIGLKPGRYRPFHHHGVARIDVVVDHDHELGPNTLG